MALFLTATVLAVPRWGIGLPQGIWLGVTLIFVVERMWTVRLAGWRAVALAGPLVLELAYDVFQQMVYLAVTPDIEDMEGPKQGIAWDVSLSRERNTDV